VIKLSANLSKKVPVPGQSYSSQQFGAALEIEVADADQPDAIKARIRALYGLLAQAVEEQIAGATGKSEAVAANGSGAKAPATPSGGNGTNRMAKATAAQQKAIFAICKSQGLDMKAVLASLNVADPAELSLRDASRLIDSLKAGQRK